MLLLLVFLPGVSANQPLDLASWLWKREAGALAGTWGVLARPLTSFGSLGRWNCFVHYGGVCTEAQGEYSGHSLLSGIASRWP